MEGAGILTRGLLSERLANVSVGSNCDFGRLVADVRKVADTGNRCRPSATE
jgi:hypothetical protein